MYVRREGTNYIQTKSRFTEEYKQINKQVRKQIRKYNTEEIKIVIEENVRKIIMR